MHGLLNIVIGVEDAVLEAESGRIAVVDHGSLELAEDLLSLSLLADENLLVVGVGIAEMLGLIAGLSGCLQVLDLHLLKRVGQAHVQVVNPLLRDVSW